MKNIIISFKVLLLFVIITMANNKSFAQTPILSVSNESFTSNTYDFDVKLTNTDTANMYLFLVQTAFYFDSLVKNGGIMSKDILFSDIPNYASLINTNSPHYLFLGVGSYNAYAYTPGHSFSPFADAYIIPPGQTVLVYRIRLKDSLANWLPNSHMNIQWRNASNSGSGFFTKLFLYNSNGNNYMVNSPIYVNTLANQNLDSTATVNQTTIITASANPVNQGTSVNFTANTQPYASGQQFEWKVNSVIQNTLGSNTFTYMPQNGDTIIAKALPYSSFGGGVSNAIVMNVIPTVNFINNIWLGNNTNWHDSQNWSLGIVPALLHNVIIPVNVSATPNYPILTNPAICNKLTFLSNQAGTAQLIDNGNYLANNDTVFAEQYLSSGRWHLISSPVVNSSSQALVGSNPLNPMHYRYLKKTIVPDTSINGQWHNYTNINFNYMLPVNNSTTLMPGFGYASLTNLPYTAVLKGSQLVSNDVAIDILGLSAVPVNKGYFLVGNPYQSALSLNNFTNWTGFSNMYSSIWIFENGNYHFTNGNIGNISIIPPHQAFMVRNISATQFIIPKTAKTISDLPLYKTIFNNLLSLKVENDTNKLYDETFVYFTYGASSNVESDKDVTKLYGDYDAPQLFSKVNSEELSINILPEIQQYPHIIPLGFFPGINGTFSITANGVNSFATSVGILLEDYKTNVFTNLIQQQEYSFVADTNDDVNRFYIHITNFNKIDKNENKTINIYAYNNTVYINNPFNISIKEITVFNILGQVVKTIKGNTDILTKIEINKASAEYIVKVTTNETVFTSKVFLK